MRLKPRCVDLAPDDVDLSSGTYTQKHDCRGVGGGTGQLAALQQGSLQLRVVFV